MICMNVFILWFQSIIDVPSCAALFVVIISFSGFFCGGLNVSADSSRMCSQVTHVKWPIKGAIEDGRAVSSAAVSRDTNQTRALSLKCKLDSFISHLPALSLFITHSLPGPTLGTKHRARYSSSGAVHPINLTFLARYYSKDTGEIFIL